MSWPKISMNSHRNRPSMVLIMILPSIRSTTSSTKLICAGPRGSGAAGGVGGGLGRNEEIRRLRLRQRLAKSGDVAVPVPGAEHAHMLHPEVGLGAAAEGEPV